MPADALTYKHIAYELNESLKGGRIDKAIMLDGYTLVLSVRANRENLNLIMSCAPSSPRCHLTSDAYSPPALPTGLNMHFRKYLINATIDGVELEPYERVIMLNLTARNELMVTEKKTLIVEIMGKYSNIIFLNGDGTISEAVKHISADTSSKRMVLPRLKYVLPPKQDKIDITSKQLLIERLTAFEGGRVDNYILSLLSGLAPTTITDAVNYILGTNIASNISRETAVKIADSLDSLYDSKAEPCLGFKDGKVKDFFAYPYKSMDLEFLPCPTLNDAVDEYYKLSLGDKSFGARTDSLEKALKNTVVKTEKKLQALKDRLVQNSDYEDDKIRGELITSNIYKLKGGLTFFETDNYYTNEKINIPLDPELNPQQNAAKYYKKYSKKKKGVDIISTQIIETEDALDYYLSIAQSFKNVNSQAEIDEIAAELAECGVCKSTRAKKKTVKLSPLKKIKVDGYDVFIGKNNLQNDSLTRSASSYDLWLHTQKIHGSHVIVKNDGDKLPPENVIKKAASFAAHYSKAQNSDNVPVDYTFVKFVKKPSGSPPGKVIYTNQRTVFVTPQKPE